MLKKIIFFITIIVLLTPIAFVNGTQINNKNDSSEMKIDITNIQTDIENMIEQVNISTLSYYLEKFVSFGFKMTGSENADEAAKWIKSEFEEIGLNTYFDEWKFPRYKDKNVVAIHSGTDRTSDAVILIIAHYDTIGDSPGAIDDGTGIAAMLTIANITSKYSFKHTIRFTAVSGEEVGTFGSFADAKKAYYNNENIICVLNVDGLGFDNVTETGNVIQLFAPDRSKWVVDYSKDIADQYRTLFDVIIQHSTNYPADHESYNDFGFDGLQFVQPSPEKAHKNPFHTPEDTIDKVDFTYLEKVTKFLIALASELALKPIDIQVRLTTPREGCFYLRNIPLKLRCFNLFFSRIRAITYIYGKTTAKVNISTNEKISSVYFGIDGYARHMCNEPPYEYKLGTGKYAYFKIKGHHKLTVCVTTNTGKTAYDEMDIYVVKRL